MNPGPGKILIIGGGIAGLCAAVYARRCGYDVEVLEQHDSVGGLATSWKRGGYTFETCLHWLLGSKPGSLLHDRWSEVFDIDRLTFVNPEEFVRLESDRGERLHIYADIARLERELTTKAPRDAAEIQRLVSAIRRFQKIDLPDFSEAWHHQLRELLRALPELAALRHWSSFSSAAYGQRFSYPLLRSFFDSGETGAMSVLAVIFSLGWMASGNAGYPIGGSKAVISALAGNLQRLGGRIRAGTRVQSVLVERDTAVGVGLAGGQTEFADWVVSAADGHETIYELLAGRYAGAAVERAYSELTPFPSYLQVSFGVARELADQPGFLTRVLTDPIAIDPATRLSQVSFRIFNYDPTFAPAGKTAVTCVLPTRAHAYWSELRLKDPSAYRTEKERVADAIRAVLERVAPGTGEAIEVTDVATPATITRYTSNWHGSMEGWIPTPATGFRPLPRTLPRLGQFVMAGQWVLPGGGLPSGLLSARAAIQTICRHDREAFAVRPAA